MKGVRNITSPVFIPEETKRLIDVMGFEKITLQIHVKGGKPRALILKFHTNFKLLVGDVKSDSFVLRIWPSCAPPSPKVC